MSEVLTVHGADMFVGETRRQGVLLTYQDGKAVVPTNAAYHRYKDGVAIDAAPVAATIEGNQIYASIPAGDLPGSFAAIFTFSVDTQIVRARVTYKVHEYR